MDLCLCLSQVEVLLKRLNTGSHKQHNTIAQQGLYFSGAKYLREIRPRSPRAGAPNASAVGQNRRLPTNNQLYLDKKLSYRRVTARCVLSVVILPITTQQCRNYILIRQVLTKPMVRSWRFSRLQCVINNVHSTMTRPSRLPLSHRCHKQTDDGRVVYITCIPTTCCGEIF